MLKNLLLVTTAALTMAAAAALPARADGTGLPPAASVPEPTSILAIVVGGAIAAHATSKSKNN
jgi:hypothetical protein